MLYVNYTSIKKERKNLKINEKILKIKYKGEMGV